MRKLPFSMDIPCRVLNACQVELAAQKDTLATVLGYWTSYPSSKQKYRLNQTDTLLIWCFILSCLTVTSDLPLELGIPYYLITSKHMSFTGLFLLYEKNAEWYLHNIPKSMVGATCPKTNWTSICKECYTIPVFS